MFRFARTSAIALIAVAGSTLAAPLMAQDAAAPSASTVIATVNGQDITLGHMLALRAELPEQYQQLPDEVLFKGILDQMVQQTVLSGLLGAPTKKEMLSIDNQGRAMKAGLMIQRLLSRPVSDAELQAAYDAKFAAAAPEMEYNASHILVKTEEEAKAIVEQLRDGGDFAAIAKEKSLDPGSGANGGELGWFGLGMMVPEFEAAVVAAKVGEITDPVKSNFGWHIIKVNETRTKEKPTLDEVREELTDQIRDERVQKAIDDAVAAATVDRSGSVDIDPSVISKMDLLNE